MKVLLAVMLVIASTSLLSNKLYEEKRVASSTETKEIVLGHRVGPNGQLMLVTR